MLTAGAYKICLYFIQKMFFVAEIQTFDTLPTHAAFWRFILLLFFNLREYAEDVKMDSAVPYALEDDH